MLFWTLFVDIIPITKFELKSVFACITLIYLGALFILLGVITFFAVIDVHKEKDKHYIVNLFAVMTSFVALITALVALGR